jgi:hypothetical protein
MSTLSTRLNARGVTIGQKRLEGDVVLPRKAKGLVIFAHGSGSSRFSPRNTHVAHELEVRGLGTLLLDLLTEREAYDRRNVFDIPLLAGRMVEAVRFARSDADLSSLPISVCSGPARVRLRPSSRPRSCRRRSPLWSRAADGRTWPETRSRRCALRHC